jgi:ABC-2 type transport system permease protein
MSAPNAASPAASAEALARPRPAALAGGPLRRIAEGTFAMSLTEWRKLRHNQLDLLTRSVQPLLWLFVFGTAMSRLHSIPTGGIEYRAYLAPGIMAQAAMFIAIFFGIAVIWERDVGQLQRLLATPLPRSAIVLGKAAGAATRALVQAVLLLGVVAIAQIGLRWTVLGVLGALVLLAIGTGAFACLSMTIASLVKERERFKRSRMSTRSHMRSKVCEDSSSAAAIRCWIWWCAWAGWESSLSRQPARIPRLCCKRCYHPAPYADDVPAGPKGPQPEDEEARHPRLEVRQGPQEEGGRASASRRLHARLHHHAEEAELGSAQGGPRAADEFDGSHGVHPRRGPQPAGALRRARARWPRQGPSGRALQGRPRHA